MVLRDISIFFLLLKRKSPHGSRLLFASLQFTFDWEKEKTKLEFKVREVQNI